MTKFGWLVFAVAATALVLPFNKTAFLAAVAVALACAAIAGATKRRLPASRNTMELAFAGFIPLACYIAGSLPTALPVFIR